jgi:hypothetical protein
MRKKRERQWPKWYLWCTTTLDSSVLVLLYLCYQELEKEREDALAMVSDNAPIAIAIAACRESHNSML